jgi:hypothetical protein
MQACRGNGGRARILNIGGTFELLHATAGRVVQKAMGLRWISEPGRGGPCRHQVEAPSQTKYFSCPSCQYVKLGVDLQ